MEVTLLNLKFRRDLGFWLWSTILIKTRIMEDWPLLPMLLPKFVNLMKFCQLPNLKRIMINLAKLLWRMVFQTRNLVSRLDINSKEIHSRFSKSFLEQQIHLQLLSMKTVIKLEQSKEEVEELWKPFKADFPIWRLLAHVLLKNFTMGAEKRLVSKEWFSKVTINIKKWASVQKSSMSSQAWAHKIHSPSLVKVIKDKGKNNPI